MACSNKPTGRLLIKKTVQQRRKDRGQDQSQDPNEIGVCLDSAGDDFETGKSNNARYSANRNSNDSTDDNLLHNISFFMMRPYKGPERSTELAAKFEASFVFETGPLDFAGRRETFSQPG